MPSTLTWIDHDAEARERSLRTLALFQERESRDELGLGGIRDVFSDLLFPGTSTIQTRLRYMLFVPWIYRDLEQRKVQPGEFARRADKAERDLIDAMRNADVREEGIFGGRSGRSLKRLPSSVYWAGLISWGILLADYSRDQYHQQIGLIYRRRSDQESRHRERSRNDDDLEQTPESGTLTWHPRLPPCPRDFPNNVTFTLTGEEAEFLLDRIQRSHPKSLLAHLALSGRLADVPAPWLHPDLAEFTDEHRELLEHGRLFSIVMHGAALIYNIMLAELRELEERVAGYRKDLENWAAELSAYELRNWSLDRLWQLTLGHGHTITPATRRFVTSWTEIVSANSANLADNQAARELVGRRERSLKKARSRLTNRRALEQWQGASGLNRMTYRWPTVKTLLADLHAGLHG